MKIDERFAPHSNLKKVYGIYLSLVAAPMLVATILPIWAVFTFAPEVWRVGWVYLFIPLAIVLIILGFLVYWIRRYCDSIFFSLTKDEVMVERGVWWKMKHVVPYARVMSIDVVQGPVSRRFGIGSVHVYTAGYTGPAGGTSGPGVRGAEACIWGVQNFVEIKDAIIEMVRGRPLFGLPRSVAPDASSEMLEELKRIRKAVEK